MLHPLKLRQRLNCAAPNYAPYRACLSIVNNARVLSHVNIRLIRGIWELHGFLDRGIKVSFVDNTSFLLLTPIALMKDQKSFYSENNAKHTQAPTVHLFLDVWELLETGTKIIKWGSINWKSLKTDFRTRILRVKNSRRTMQKRLKKPCYLNVLLKHAT